MDKALDAYLAQVTQQLKWLPPTARAAEMREVEDHLRTMVEAQQAQGISYRDAVDESIRQFGNAKRVGNALARAWHKRQPESIGRALLAFIVALVCQYLFLCGAIGFASFFWLHISLDSHVVAELLFFLVIAPVSAGFFATVIAPRRGQGAAWAAYFAVITLFLWFTLSPSLFSTFDSSFKGLNLTIDFLLLSSGLGVLCGSWLGRHWILQKAIRQPFKYLQRVGHSPYKSKGDTNGS